MKPVTTGTIPSVSRGPSVSCVSRRVSSVSGAADWKALSVRTISAASIGTAGVPSVRSAPASRWTLMRSPRDETASSARGEASPSTASASQSIANSLSRPSIGSSTTVRSPLLSPSSPAAVWCLVRNVSIRSRTWIRSPRTAAAAPPSSASVTPLIAEVTTTTGWPARRRSAAIPAAVAMAWPLPTDVPPNLMTRRCAGMAGRTCSVANWAGVVQPGAFQRVPGGQEYRSHGHVNDRGPVFIRP